MQGGGKMRANAGVSSLPPVLLLNVLLILFDCQLDVLSCPVLIFIFSFVVHFILFCSFRGVEHGYV